MPKIPFLERDMAEMTHAELLEALETLSAN